MYIYYIYYICIIYYKRMLQLALMGAFLPGRAICSKKAGYPIQFYQHCDNDKKITFCLDLSPTNSTTLHTYTKQY